MSQPVVVKGTVVASAAAQPPAAQPVPQAQTSTAQPSQATASTSPQQQQPCNCCNEGMTQKKLVRLILGGVSLLALIFALSDVSAPIWTYAAWSGYFDYEVIWNLWRVTTTVEDDDDNEVLKKKYVDDELFEVIEFNRGATMLALFVTLGATIYYLSTAMCVLVAPVEIVVGSFMIIMGIFAWAGAGSWSSQWEDFLDDDAYDETRPCDAGCGLEAWNGVFYFGLGISMIVFAVMELACPQNPVCLCCPTLFDANEQRPEPVATSELPPEAPPSEAREEEEGDERDVEMPVKAKEVEA